MRIFAFILFYLLHGLVRCQSLSPSVIASSGQHFSNGTQQISWTLGEPVIQTHNAGNYRITQGFHQPYLQVNSITEWEDLGILAFPNPTKNQLRIQFPDQNHIWELRLIDILGRRVLEVPGTQVQEYSISLENLPSSHYLLEVRDQSSGKRQLFKIQKID